MVIGIHKKLKLLRKRRKRRTFGEVYNDPMLCCGNCDVNNNEWDHSVDFDYNTINYKPTTYSVVSAILCWLIWNNYIKLQYNLSLYRPTLHRVLVIFMAPIPWKCGSQGHGFFIVGLQPWPTSGPACGVVSPGLRGPYQFSFRPNP